MAVLNAVNGMAPSNAQIGDTIRTDGGNYLIVPPNTPGARNGSGSGFWSIKQDSSEPEYLTSAKALTSTNNAYLSNAAELANSISARSSAEQYRYNAEEAQKTRDWQEMMSSTAHQREVKDLIAAGLNPVLSANAGASTPSGATAAGASYTGQKADVDTSLLPFYAQILGAAMNNSTQKDIARIQAETSTQNAKISSAASMYAANQAAEASRYGAGLSAAAMRYGADQSYASSSWLNKFVDKFVSGNAKDLGDGLGKSFGSIFDFIKNYLFEPSY